MKNEDRQEGCQHGTCPGQSRFQARRRQRKNAQPRHPVPAVISATMIVAVVISARCRDEILPALPLGHPAGLSSGPTHAASASGTNGRVSGLCHIASAARSDPDEGAFHPPDRSDRGTPGAAQHRKPYRHRRSSAARDAGGVSDCADLQRAGCRSDLLVDGGIFLGARGRLGSFRRLRHGGAGRDHRHGGAADRARHPQPQRQLDPFYSGGDAAVASGGQLGQLSWRVA